MPPLAMANASLSRVYFLMPYHLRKKLKMQRCYSLQGMATRHMNNGTTDATSSYGKRIPQQGLFLDAISPTQKVEDATLLWLTRHGYKAYE